MATTIAILLALVTLTLAAFYYFVGRSGSFDGPPVPLRKAGRSPAVRAPAQFSPTVKPSDPRRVSVTDKAVATSCYNAVSVSGGSCSAVLEIAGRRYLEAEVPKLPLQGCDAATCDCNYVRHEDRRDSQADRRSPRGLQSDLYGSTNENEDRRQRSRGRRKDDLV